MPGLGISFGRGGATTFQQDLQHADCILIQGSNMAECHPVGFRWVMKAKANGAKIIHVDPRFTRTSAVADLHVPLRAGSDIAFLGGIIHYIIEHARYFTEYVVPYTNAANVVKKGFADTDELDGLFSGFEDGKYKVDSWQYEGCDIVPGSGHKEASADIEARGGDEVLAKGITEERDETLQHPRCVFQLVKRHYARYTPEIVEQICGVPKAQFLEVCEALCANSGRDRTSAICYAVGWTQHSVGVQYIRAAAIIQLLLGNIGRPGGGIMALRGHASIQGSTDIPTLFDLLPGYLPMPSTKHSKDLAEYLRTHRSDSGWWSENPKYMVSLLKAWFGEHAEKGNDFMFGALPLISGDHSHMATIALMADGKVPGYFVMGENPLVGTVGGRMQREGMMKLKWLVVRDFAPTETAEFWRADAERCATEVFFFPAATHTEKDGTFTNTQRMLQWHHKAVPPPGDARSELWFAYHLGLRLKQRCTLPRDVAIQALTWKYGPGDEPDAEQVLHEINGYRVNDGEPVDGFKQLEADGTTACGCWIYSGCYAKRENLPARRTVAQTWVAAEWGWAWPMNRRLLYNRASADPAGVPWSERKRYVWWDPAQAKWVGEDVPDFIDTRPPDYRPAKDAFGLATIAGDMPFLMQSDGRGWLFAPSGIIDGPLPTHYEPNESVVRNLLYGQQQNPTRVQWKRRDNPMAGSPDRRFPYLLTTFRLTEHHTAGGMSRWLPWLSELQPELFCEVSVELAGELGIENGGWVTLRTARAALDCKALVTRRLAPMHVAGTIVHQIAVPYHFGSVGLVTGPVVNELFGMVADPNVYIPESKVTTCDVVRRRR